MSINIKFMEDIKEVYPDAINDFGSFNVSNYDPMIESFGYKILVNEMIGGWSGDILVLLKDGNKYGFVSIGYGSCPGCDVLKSCSSYEDLNKLRENIERDIVWANGIKEMINYLKGEEIKNKFFWMEEKSKEVIDKMIDALKKEDK